MGRGRILTFALAALLCAAAGAQARQGSQQQKAPPDRITLDDFKTLLASGEPVVILDVRGHIESKIKGAHHIPLGELESRLGEVPRGREVVTYCA